MINKKIIILAIFLVSLLSISVVSANDNITHDVISVDDTTEFNSIHDNVVSADNSNESDNLNDNLINMYELENDEFTNNNYKLGNKESHDVILQTTTDNAPSYENYSVFVSDTIIKRESGGSISMKITPTTDFMYEYNYYLKIYDSDNNEIISQLYTSEGKQGVYSKTYNIGKNQLDPGEYAIKIINYADNGIMSAAKLKVKPTTPTSSGIGKYSVNVPSVTVNYNSTGRIYMGITPASSSTYKYYFYLKIYDSKNNEMFSKTYSNTKEVYSETLLFSPKALNLYVDDYTIKIIDHDENRVMTTSTLKVITPSAQSPYPSSSDYSVNISNSIINYNSQESINMSISSTSSSTYKYYYYFKVYDSNNNEKISTIYSGTKKEDIRKYSFSANKLTPGKYTIKIINHENGKLMCTSQLTVKPSIYPLSSDYSVSVSSSTINYGSTGVIKMSISAAPYSDYKYYYYLKICNRYDYAFISNTYSGTDNVSSATYTFDANQLGYGSYILKIINYADDEVMDTAYLTVKPSTNPHSSQYSVSVSDSTISSDVGGDINMNIYPTTNPKCATKYFYYLKVYDSNNNEKISYIYSSTDSDKKYKINVKYSFSANQLTPGNYTVKLINYADKNLLDTAYLTVKHSLYPSYSDYSVKVYSPTIMHHSNGAINMTITPSSCSVYTYYYYFKIFDSNNNEKFSNIYSSTKDVDFITDTIFADQLDAGIYTVKIINYKDNNIMNISTLTVKPSFPLYSDYSVIVDSATINYNDRGVIHMNITPSSSSTYKYYYYLKIYDSKNNVMISENFSSIADDYFENYNIDANQLSPGNYTIKIINIGDSNVMSTATLTVKSNESIVTPEDNTTKPTPDNVTPKDNTTKPTPDIVIPPLNNVSNDESISVKLPSDATGVVTLTINNKDYDFDVVNGIANVILPNLDNGNYDYTITYSGDNTYSSFTSSNTLRVNNEVIKKHSLLSSTPVTTTYNGGKYLIVVLKGSDSIPIVGVEVNIVLNGKTYVHTTGSNGQVKVSTNGLAPGGYIATINFEGNDNYLESSSIEKVNVKKATPKITAKAKTFKKSVKTKKYTITLKNNLNKIMKNTKVTIKVNKKTYSAKTNSKGVATFKITKLTKKGSFISVITYNGNKYYNKITKKVKINVK